MIYFITDKTQIQYYDRDLNFTNLDDCLFYLKDKKVIGLDIETSRKYKKYKYREDIYKPGLDPYFSRICMLQIGDLDNQYIIDVRFVDIAPLKSILEDKSILKVGHNLKFETKHLLLIYLKNFYQN